jgi:hypothetical protein
MDAPPRSMAVNWFQRVRLRVFAVLVAAVLAVIGVLSWATLPAWPVVGVAIITVAAVVNSMTTRLSHAVCYQCGDALKTTETGCYGVICEGCGAINQALPQGDDRRFASGDADLDGPASA